jgi:predicted phosphodiesterase
MSIQILSDLHLEAPKAYDVFKIIPKAPYLALLGDIGKIVPHKDDCLAFLKEQLRQFRAVFFVPGNHEGYHSTWPETLSILCAFEEDVRKDSSLGEFVLLDRRT